MVDFYAWDNTVKKIINTVNSWLAATVIVLAMISLYQSFIPQTLPIKMSTSEYSAVKTRDGTIVVSQECTSTVLAPFEATIFREAVHTQTGLIVSLPTTITKFTEGKRDIQRQFYIPNPAPSGEWCVKAQLDWHPFLSLKGHSIHAPVKCFTVK